MTRPRDQFADLTQRGHEVFAAAVRAWEQAARSLTTGAAAGLPNARMGDLGAAVDAAFDFAAQMLAEQRDFAKSLMSAGGQVLATAARRAEGDDRPDTPTDGRQGTDVEPTAPVAVSTRPPSDEPPPAEATAPDKATDTSPESVTDTPPEEATDGASADRTGPAAGDAEGPQQSSATPRKATPQKATPQKATPRETTPTKKATAARKTTAAKAGPGTGTTAATTPADTKPADTTENTGAAKKAAAKKAAAKRGQAAKKASAPPDSGS
jgi:hypothetical protein